MRCPGCGVPVPDLVEHNPVCTGPLPTEAWRDDPAEYDRLKADLDGMNPHDAAVIRHHHNEGKPLAP